MSFRPVEVGYVDRPDHPSLRDSGCSEKSRRAFVYGAIGGLVFGVAWGLATSYRFKLVGREHWRNLGRSAALHTTLISGVLGTAFMLPCY